MCGRVRQTTPANTIANAYNACIDYAATLLSPGDYTAGEKPLAIHQDEDGPIAAVSRWGPPVPWVPVGKLLRHARSETALTKRTFSEPAKGRRCIVPVDAWFEWGTRPGAERKHHAIAAQDGSITGLAALWWPAAIVNMPRRFVIVTKNASGAPAEIHHRTPMIVLDDNVDAWLDAQSDLDTVRTHLARPSANEGVFEVGTG